MKVCWTTKSMFHYSSVVSPASACPDMETGFRTMKTGPAATASPAPLTTATGEAPARSTQLRKKSASKSFMIIGDSVAEWSKALLMNEKMNENQGIQSSSPSLGNLLKKESLRVRPCSRWHEIKLGFFCQQSIFRSVWSGRFHFLSVIVIL